MRGNKRLLGCLLAVCLLVNAALPAAADPASCAHANRDVRFENEVKGTCLQPGLRDKVEFCLDCKNDVDRETVEAPCEQNMQFLEVTEPATCSAEGGKYILQYCDICGDKFSREYSEYYDINPEAHTWCDWVVTIPATCSAEGVMKRTCEIDAKHTETTPLEIHDDAHAWGEWIVTTPATCSAQGVMTRTCEIDATHTETTPLEIHDDAHAWGEWVVTTPATCAANGVQTRVCLNDAAHKQTDATDVPINPEAHAWGEWVVTTPATCSAEGVQTRTCANNALHAETAPVDINPEAHAWGEWGVVAPATCISQGTRTRHCRNNTSHMEAARIAIDPEAHAWRVDTSNWVSVPATCEFSGIQGYVCKYSVNHMKSETIPALEHELDSSGKCIRCQERIKFLIPNNNNSSAVSIAVSDAVGSAVGSMIGSVIGMTQSANTDASYRNLYLRVQLDQSGSDWYEMLPDQRYIQMASVDELNKHSSIPESLKALDGLGAILVDLSELTYIGVPDPLRNEDYFTIKDFLQGERALTDTERKTMDELETQYSSIANVDTMLEITLNLGKENANKTFEIYVPGVEDGNPSIMQCDEYGLIRLNISSAALTNAKFIFMPVDATTPDERKAGFAAYNAERAGNEVFIPPEYYSSSDIKKLARDWTESLLPRIGYLPSAAKTMGDQGAIELSSFVKTASRSIAGNVHIYMENLIPENFVHKMIITGEKEASRTTDGGDSAGNAKDSLVLGNGEGTRAGTLKSNTGALILRGAAPSFKLKEMFDNRLGVNGSSANAEAGPSTDTMARGGITTQNKITVQEGASAAWSLRRAAQGEAKGQEGEITAQGEGKGQEGRSIEADPHQHDRADIPIVGP